MKNKFACTCANCGRMVAVGDGDTNMVDGKWKTTHAEPCARPVQRSYVNHRNIAMDCFDLQCNDYYNPYPWAESSEDLNPNEGSK